MASRIKPGVVPRHGNRIPEVKTPPDEDLRFSFKHLDFSNPKFHTDRCGNGYLERFLTRLRDVSKIKVTEFRTNRSPALKSHRIAFEDTTEAAGFSNLNEQLRTEEAWQFEVTRNEHGRVHGLLVGETFYVVWLDPDHQLYD
jgi:hypothetical protein